MRGRSSYLINVLGNTHLNKKPKLSVCLLGVGHDWESKSMHVPKHFSVCFPDLNQGSPFLAAQIWSMKYAQDSREKQSPNIFV